MVDGKVSTTDRKWRRSKVGVPKVVFRAPLDVKRFDFGVGRVVAGNLGFNGGRGGHDAGCRENLLKERLETILVDVVMGEGFADTSASELVEAIFIKSDPAFARGGGGRVV